MLKKVRDKLSLLGPSILWASAAIGVSHIVQSTRAGATYGYSLILIVILANVLKYPFFEFATRYTVVKNETVLDGYRRIGKWAIYLYTVLTVSTMFTIQAGVTLVTAAIFENWLNINLGLFLSSFIITQIFVDDKLYDYVANLVFATRSPELFGLKDLNFNSKCG